MTEPATPADRPLRSMTDEEFAAKFTKDAIRKAAVRLRTIADDLELHLTQVTRVGANLGPVSYGQVASDAISTMRNGLFNLHLENIVTYASQADIYRAAAKAGEPE